MFTFDKYIHQVHSDLSQYIQLHNKVFNSSNGLSKIIRIFIPINFGKIKLELNYIQNNLISKENEIRNIEYNKDAIAEKKLYDNLLEFIGSLKKTMNNFDIILQGLIKKSENKSYSETDYKKDYNKYISSIDEYKEKGTNLNEANNEYIKYSSEQMVKNLNSGK